MPFDGHIQVSSRPYDGAVRDRAVDRVEFWLTRQSSRLGISESEILELIKRGWLPHFIEGTTAGCVNDFDRAPSVAAILAGRPIFDTY